MGRKKILFVGKGNAVNNELIQALDEAFDMNYCMGVEGTVKESIKLTGPDALLVSLIGGNYNYDKIFEMMKTSHYELPVITIGTEYESKKYAKYYKSDQFFNIIRPVSGPEIIEKCSIIVGKEANEKELADRKEEEAQKAVIRQMKITEEEKAHILIVDDNAMVLRNVKAMLEDRYSVAVAASASQAFVSIGKKRPDLILLDYHMPMMDGKEMLEMMQEDTELGNIPVVFLTSVDIRKEVTKVLSLKPAGYVLKPAEREVLIKMIEKVLSE